MQWEMDVYVGTWFDWDSTTVAILQIISLPSFSNFISPSYSLFFSLRSNSFISYHCWSKKKIRHAFCIKISPILNLAYGCSSVTLSLPWPDLIYQWWPAPIITQSCYGPFPSFEFAMWPPSPPSQGFLEGKVNRKPILLPLKAFAWTDIANDL